VESIGNLFDPDAQIRGVFGSASGEQAVAVWRPQIVRLGIQLTIEDMLVEDDRVAVRSTGTGFFEGPSSAWG
jgi:hypothetical protein